MSHDTRSIAILAGGRATRFGGQDKSALLVDGRTILDRQLAEFSALTADLLIVGGDAVARGFQPSDRVERRLEPIVRGSERAAPHSTPPQITTPRLITDLVPGCGPLGGLHAALTAARGDHVAVIACDMPYVSADFVAYLFSLAGHADIVVPMTERGYHPLCAVYARGCLTAVTAQLAERRLKMTALLADTLTRVVTAEDIERFGDRHRLLANVNTPTEYASLEALQGHEL